MCMGICVDIIQFQHGDPVGHILYIDNNIQINVSKAAQEHGDIGSNSLMLFPT